MDPLGSVFPPRNVDDILMYDDAELLAGFMEFRKDEPMPGENRHPAYRWGWQNAFRDRVGPDPYDEIRRMAAPMVLAKLRKLN